MNRNRSIGVHVEKCGLNNINHFVTTGRIDGNLKMGNYDAKIPSETEKKYNKIVKP